MSSVAIAVDALVAEGDFALRADQAADRAQRRGLAGAVGAEQRGHAALANREIDAVENLGFAVGGVEALGLKQVGHARVLHVMPMPQPAIRLRSLCFWFSQTPRETDEATGVSQLD